MTETQSDGVRPRSETAGEGTSDDSICANRFPPLWVWALLGTLAGALIYIRVRPPMSDHAAANVATLVIGAAAFMVLATWFVALSGYSRLLRLSTLSLALLGIAIFFARYRVLHVSGEMVPIFAPRFTAQPDQLLEIPSTGTPLVEIDLATTTEYDFPQFLGRQRRARTDAVRLTRDWEQRPPQLLWRKPIGAGWSAFAAVNGYAVTMEQRGDFEFVTCYAIETGELLWAHSVTARHSNALGGVGPRSTPTIYDGRVYSLGAAGDLLCLDGASGRVIWEDNLLRRRGITLRQETAEIPWGRAASPLIVDQLVVVPAGGPPGGPYVSLAAFDAQSGALVWEAGDRQISYASPIVATLAGVRQIVSVNQDSVSAHDPIGGHVLWEYDWPGNTNQYANIAQPVALDEHHVLLSKAYGRGAMLLNIVTSRNAAGFAVRQVWHQTQLLKTKFTNVVLDAGFAYALSDGILECVEVLPGRRKWKRGRYGHGQILGVGDLLLVQAENGRIALVAASPDEHQELAQLEALDGTTWNNLCLYGPYLLARNAEQACCYVLPLDEALTLQGL